MHDPAGGRAPLQLCKNFVVLYQRKGTSPGPAAAAVCFSMLSVSFDSLRTGGLHILSGFSSSVPLRGKLRTTWVTEDNSEQEMEKFLQPFNLARVFHRRFVYNASN